jgi:putative methyltransferase (TIGR04325 family)
MSIHIKNIARDWVPPAAIRIANTIIDVMRPSTYEFIGYSWPQGMQLKGWNADSVQENRQQSWDMFVSSMEETSLLGLSEDDLLFPRHINIDTQSLYLSFGYCLGLACQKKQTVSVLDWGGGVGNYYVISRKLFPEVIFTYHCADLPLACSMGRKLLPNVIFHDAETWNEMQFDLVFSSSSLQYLEDWRSTVDSLIKSSDNYLYITRMPFVIVGRSFVMIQRAVCYGTEYLGWVLNRDEFVQFVEQRGMKLVRQFVNHSGPRIKHAPEQNLYMGFLFEK